MDRQHITCKVIAVAQCAKRCCFAEQTIGLRIIGIGSDARGVRHGQAPTGSGISEADLRGAEVVLSKVGIRSLRLQTVILIVVISGSTTIEAGLCFQVPSRVICVSF